MPGGPELIWILVVCFLLFGAKKLPELARSAGESLKEFKKATKEAMEEDARPTVAETPRRLEAPASEPASAEVSKTA